MVVNLVRSWLGQGERLTSLDDLRLLPACEVAEDADEPGNASRYDDGDISEAIALMKTRSIESVRKGIDLGAIYPSTNGPLFNSTKLP